MDIILIVCLCLQHISLHMVSILDQSTVTSHFLRCIEYIQYDAAPPHGAQLANDVRRTARIHGKYAYIIELPTSTRGVDRRDRAAYPTLPNPTAQPASRPDPWTSLVRRQEQPRQRSETNPKGQDAAVLIHYGRSTRRCDVAWTQQTKLLAI